jgi:hypothetical protein
MSGTMSDHMSGTMSDHVSGTMSDRVPGTMSGTDDLCTGRSHRGGDRSVYPANGISANGDSGIILQSRDVQHLRDTRSLRGPFALRERIGRHRVPQLSNRRVAR